MADTKDFESLDELFRKTLDNLPDTPAKSGWDTPSERVWQHVQTQIKPPKSGWSIQTLSLLTAFAVTLTVGLYLLLSRPATAEKPAATPQPTAETTEQPVASVQGQIVETQTTLSETTPSPAKILKKKPAVANPPATTSETPRNEKEMEAETAKTQSADSSAKSSGKKPPSPNTTERLKAELAKRAEEAWKTPLQTLPQRWPGKTSQ
jgi:type IV secretory pathway VirB10-like protein